MAAPPRAFGTHSTRSHSTTRSARSLISASVSLLDAPQALLDVANGEVDHPHRRHALVRPAGVTDACCRITITAEHVEVRVAFVFVLHRDVLGRPANDLAIEVARRRRIGDR